MCGLQAAMSIGGMMMSAMQQGEQQSAQDAQQRAQADAEAIQAKQRADEATYNAQIASNNAVVQRNQAQSEKTAAELHVAKAKMDAGLKEGSQRAAMGASGALLNGGTNADIQANTMLDAEMDAMMIRTSGDNKASAYEAAAKNYESQRDIDLWAGSDYGRKETPTLLTQSSPVSSKWDPLRQAASA